MSTWEGCTPNADWDHRDHGAAPFSGDASIGMPSDDGHPGTDNIDHLLQVPLDLMLPTVGARLFLAGEVLVVNDFFPENNFRWTEVFPDWNESRLTFTTGQSGLGLNTIPHLVPTPTALQISPLAVSLIATARRRRSFSGTASRSGRR